MGHSDLGRSYRFRGLFRLGELFRFRGHSVVKVNCLSASSGTKTVVSEAKLQNQSFRSSNESKLPGKHFFLLKHPVFPNSHSMLKYFVLVARLKLFTIFSRDLSAFFFSLVCCHKF